jgi:hypothetical protein
VENRTWLVFKSCNSLSSIKSPEMPTSNTGFSRILSYILHPLLIPTLATTALLLKPELYSIVLPFAIKIWFLMVVFVFTFAIPVICMLILLKFKVIQSLEMNERTERTIPLLIASGSFMALLFTLRSTGMPAVFLYVLYSATIALMAGLLINLVYKISLHTLGWGALTATLTAISIRMGAPLLSFIALSIILSGCVGYARLKQNAHNQTQVYLGYIAGAGLIILITFLQ